MSKWAKQAEDVESGEDQSKSQSSQYSDSGDEEDNSDEVSKSGSGSDSEESVYSSSDGEESDSEEEKAEDGNRAKGGKKGKTKRVVNYYDDSDSDEGQRKVISKKEQRWTAMKTIIKKIKDKMKNNDYVQIFDMFVNLNKELEKASKITMKEGVPKFYIDIILKIEGRVLKVDKEQTRQFNKQKLQAFSKLKQRIKKNKRNYSEEIAQRLIELQQSSSEEESSEESLSGSEVSSSDEEEDGERQIDFREQRELMTPLQRRAYWLKKENPAIGEMKNILRNLSKELQVDNNYEKILKTFEDLMKTTKRMQEDELPSFYIEVSYKMQQYVATQSSDEKACKRLKSRVKRNARKYKGEIDEFIKENNLPPIVEQDDSDSEDGSDDFNLNEDEKQRVEIPKEEKEIKKLFIDIKDNIQRNQSENIQKCRDVIEFYSQDPIKQIEIYVLMMTIQYDFLKSRNTIHVPEKLWLRYYNDIVNFFDIIIRPGLDYSQLGTLNEKLAGNNECFTFRSFTSYFQQLDGMLFKALRKHKDKLNVYQNRLKNVNLLIKLAIRATNFFQTRNPEVHVQITNSQQKIKDLREERNKLRKEGKDKERKMKEKQMDRMKDLIVQMQQSLNHIVVFAYSWLDNVAYIHDDVLTAMRQRCVQNKQDFSDEFFAEENTEAMIQRICSNIYTSSNKKYILFAMYQQITHHAMHNRYMRARNLLFNTTTIENSDFAQDQEFQQLYNRSVIAISQCAFRLGKIHESFQLVNQIFNNLKLREMLGQARIRNSGTRENDLLPLHQHMNEKVIQETHWVVVMLMEMERLAHNSHASHMNQLSKNFWRMRDKYHKEQFFGEPENSNDIIFMASNALLKGNWQQCNEYILRLDFWKEIPYCETTKANILDQIKQSAFKCFIFSYQRCYESLSLTKAQETFDLDLKVIKQLVGKLIFTRKLNAQIDYNGDSLIFYRQEVSRLQQSGQELLQIVRHQVYLNEKLLDKKGHMYGFQDDAPQISYNKKKRRRKHQLTHNYKTNRYSGKKNYRQNNYRSRNNNNRNYRNNRTNRT